MRMKSDNLFQLNQHHNFSIHTFELSLKFDTRLFHIIRNRLKTVGHVYPDSHHEEGTVLYGVRNSRFPGIRVKLKQTTHWMATQQRNGHKNYIILIVCPQTIVQAQRGYFDSVEIFEASPENCHLVEQTILHLCCSIGLHQMCGKEEGSSINLIPRGMESFLMTRLDFCVNHQFASPEEVRLYLKLARQAHYPLQMEPRTYYCPIAHRKKQYPNEVKFEGATLSIYAYDKQAQLLDAFGGRPSDYPTAKGVLRIEIQSMRGKLAYLMLRKPEHELSNREILHQSHSISRAEFERYLPTIFHSGVYISHKQIGAVLQHCVKGGTLKERYWPELWEYVKNVRSEGCVTIVAERYRENDKNNGTSQYSRIQRQLKKLGINPVLAPAGIKGQYGTISVPSIPQLFGIIQNVDRGVEERLQIH